jgi:hypothetical protein
VTGDPRIAILIPYFGRWEPWTHLFFETVRRNPSIDFFVFTDCDPAGLESENVTFHRLSFADYTRRIQAVFPEFTPSDAYKICDYRPLFGRIHEGELQGYDFWGWCDIDLLFGDIRVFYDRDVLSNYDVISTHADRISGHLALFRNTERNRSMYQRIYDWKSALRNKEIVGIDEWGFTNAFLMTVFDRLNEKFGWALDNSLTRWMSHRRRRRLYLREQYTTPFLPKPWLDGTLNSDQPSRWFWKDGTVSNARDGARAFLYLHLMNFKSSRWRHDGTPAPWVGRRDVCQAKVADMKAGIVIDERGIRPLSQT